VWGEINDNKSGFFNGPRSILFQRLVMYIDEHLRELADFGGVFRHANAIRSSEAGPDAITQIVNLGDVRQLSLAHSNSHRRHYSTMTAAGTAMEENHARLLAYAEALERYSACMFDERQFIWASANELGGHALDLQYFPCCSKTELSHPKCSLVPPDRGAPIRWVRALSLSTGDLTYVPAIVTYLYCDYKTPAERFWLPISTGCAAHTSYAWALTKAILEVVERDAISILWLQKLALPRVTVDEVNETLKPPWDEYMRCSLDLEYHVFDATTDLGFPTAYAVQTSAADPRLRTLVACSTDFNMAAAIAKTFFDLASVRIALNRQRSIPDNWDDYRHILDGATFMARSEQREAFNCLLNSPDTRKVSTAPSFDAVEDSTALRIALTKLKNKGLDCYAVDLTTDEARRVGFRIVRVIIPGLQPLSFNYRARYLGHRRLYEAPSSMGYRVHGEEELNAWPQPFA
jgi:ribosomal protein S12 methylthiotransferase accessory factor